MTSSNRLSLKEIRARITNEYFPTLVNYPAWNSDEEHGRCKAIEKIYESIHVDMKKFISGVFLYCSKIAGPAPCNYAFVSLGSTSRKEATPYSDLEFAILLERVKSDDSDQDSEARAYFRFLTYLIQVEILKLGETLLPSLGIASLNNFYSENKEDDWFYDDVVPNGFSFDGSMPWACKTPLGRKSWRGKPAQEYIMTIDEMLDLQNVSASSSKECLETANVFSSVCFLYGDENLVTTYQQKLSAILSDTTRVVSFRHQTMVVMRNLLEKYQINNLELKGFGMQQNVKEEVYRLVSLLVEQIAKYFEIFGKSSWQSIREMCEREILTMESARNLLVALSITTELRLQCYQKHGMQKEALPTVPQLSLSGNEDTPNTNTSTIIRLYNSLFPLTNTMLQALENPLSSDIHSVLLNANLYDDTPFSRGMAYMRMLNLPKALECFDLVKESVNDSTKVKVLLLQAYCYRMVGRFQKVLECCQEVEDLYSTVPQSLHYDDHLQALLSMMHTFMDLDLYQEALKIQEQIKACSSSLKKDALIYFLISSAALFTKMKRPRVAEILFKRTIDMLPNPRKSYFAYFTCINNFAVLLLDEDRFMEAIDILEHALLIAKELYGENAIHSFVACCLTNLSKAYYGLHNIEKGNHFLQTALAIYKHVHGAEHIDPKTVDALVTKARAYQFVGKWEEMRNTLVEAKQLAITLYGNQPHPLVALILYQLGHCEYLRGGYSIALNYYNNSLKIFKDHSNEIGSSKAYHCERAAILLVIASIGNVCAFENSRLVSLMEKALELEEEVHGKETNHVHFAQCYTRIGCNLVHKTMGKHGQEYLEKALRIFLKLKLENTYNYGHAHFQIGVVLCHISPHKAEEHLKTAERVLKKILKNENHIVFLTINCCMLQLCKKANRIMEGVNIADKINRQFIERRLSTTTQLSLAELYQVFKVAGFFESCGRRHTARDVLIKLISHIENHIDPTNREDEHFMFLLWISEQQAGNIYASDERFDEAEAMFQRIITSTKTSTSKESFAYDACMKGKLCLAHVFINTNRDSQAHDILSDLVKKYETNPNQFVNPLHPVTVFWLLGGLHLRRLRLDLASEDLKRALEIYNDTRGKMPLSVGKYELKAQIMNTLGLVYEKGNNLKLALQYFRSCLDVVEGKEAPIEIAMFNHNMADTLRKIGSFDDALLHYRKSLEIRETLHAEDPVREDIATVLYNIALTQYSCARYGEAIETLAKLLPLRQNLLKKGGESQNYCAALVLKGNCHIKQPNEAQQAKDAYEKAVDLLLKMSEGQPDKDCATALTNLGKTQFGFQVIFISLSFRVK